MYQTMAAWLWNVDYQVLKAIFMLHTGIVVGKTGARAIYATIVLGNCRQTDAELLLKLRALPVDKILFCIDRFGGRRPRSIAAKEVYAREALRAYKALRDQHVKS